MLSMSVNKNPFGIDQISQSALNIYPNPASDLIYIESTTGNNIVSKVTLFNAQGIEVLSMVPGNSQEKATLDLGNIADGLYFLHVYTNEGVLTRQVVIRK